MQAIAATQVHDDGPRPPFLTDSDSPDESLGEASDVGLYAHFIRQDCGQDTCLDLSGCALDEHATRLLIQSLRHHGHALSHLTTLRLTHATHLLELLEVLKPKAQHLQVLDLSNNDFGDELVDVLASWLPSSLTSLDISGNHLTDDGAARMLTALGHLGTAMEKLSLSGNRLGPKAANALGDLLRSPLWSNSLRELSLSRCGLDDATASAVAEGVHKAVALQFLDVSHNAYALSLASPLSPMRSVTLPASLRSLSLAGVLFKTALVRGLATSLLPCSESLEELRLSGCLEGDDALHLLFALVRCLPSLRTLDLSNCRLTYRSGKLLGQKLVVFANLERVNLSMNLLDLEGVADLSCGLARMARLVSLCLDGCHLGNCGAASVVTSVTRSAAPVREIDLSNNGITDVGVRDICTQLCRPTSPKLKLLVLSRNPCTLQSRVQLEGMMNEHQCDCVVLARDTPLDEVASANNSTNNSTIGSDASSLFS